MDLEQLTAFDRVVRAGSFSRAARELHLAQPTISTRIQILEQEVGGPLLVRSNHGAKLTPLGVSFLPYARRALAAMLDGVAAAQEARRGLRGRVTIGALGSLAEALLAPALAKFQAHYPTVECYARSADHIPMIDLLYDGIVELAIVAWPCVQPLTTDLKPLLRFHEPVPFVVPPHHPFATRAQITQADILAAEMRFLLLRWWQITPPELTRLAAHAYLSSDLPREIAYVWTCEGHGHGFFTQAYIHHDLQTGRLVAVPVADLAPLYRDSALVCFERQSQLSPAAEALVQEIRERALQLGILEST
ncbi:MAG: LysR family transcriptional regulator [Caldilineaceae bacterium]|nr:LysR family transcriptional regulator [Caldilineaceae bacterium]